MIAVLLLLIVAGIAIAQAASDPRQVTLRWLRLGGLIGVGLLAVAGVALWQTPIERSVVRDVALVWDAGVVFVPGLCVLVQLMLVEAGLRRSQRVAAGVAAVVAVLFAALAYLTLYQPAGLPIAFVIASLVLTPLFSAALMGGSLMTMLLGHAYLTAGSEMTQRPFHRLVALVAVALILRTVASIVFGVLPYLGAEDTGRPSVWLMTMIAARYAVGVVTPAVLLYMTWDCVRRRSNQSATGILYVLTLLLMLGEGIALGLIDGRGWVF